MARKLNSWKASQAAGEQAAAGYRQPVTATAAQYLAQLRPQPFKISPPRPRQQINVQIEEQPLSLCEVKIIQPG